MNAIGTVTMEGNGLEIGDITDDNDFLANAIADIEAIALNQLTKAQVLAKYQELITSKFGGNAVNAGIAIRNLAYFVFKNGAHESLPDDLRINNNLNWGQLKAQLGWAPKKKSLFLRFCCPIMTVLARSDALNVQNVMFRLATKWELMDEYNRIPPAVRYFGGYYDFDASAGDRARIRSFQKQVISLSDGGGRVAAVAIGPNEPAPIM